MMKTENIIKTGQPLPNIFYIIAPNTPAANSLTSIPINIQNCESIFAQLKTTDINGTNMVFSLEGSNTAEDNEWNTINGSDVSVTTTTGVTTWYIQDEFLGFPFIRLAWSSGIAPTTGKIEATICLTLKCC